MGVVGQAHDTSAALRDASAGNGTGKSQPVDFSIVWPPLLAGFIVELGVGTAVLIAALFGHDSAAGSWVAIGTPMHLCLIAVLIILTTDWGVSSALRPVWIIVAAQIVICLGAELLSVNLNLPFAINGPWLIVTATLARSWLVSLGLETRETRRRWSRLSLI
jgi:hypothetical protein